MNDWLEIDNLRNAILSLEFSVECLEKVHENNFNWKWVIIGIHNAFQSYMVLALRGSNPVNIMREKDAEEWLKAYEEKSKLPEYKLDTFLNLYKKIKSDRMMMYTNSKKFTPKDSEEKSVKRLNRLRNEFMHYKLGGWVIQIGGLPGITLDILNIISFLANDSENVFWSDSTFKDQTNKLLSKGRSYISIINLPGEK